LKCGRGGATLAQRQRGQRNRRQRFRPSATLITQNKQRKVYIFRDGCHALY